MERLVVTAVIPTMALAAGGPTFSVAALCEATALAGTEQSLFTVQTPAGAAEHFPSPELVETIPLKGLHFQRPRIIWAPCFRSTFHAFCRKRRVQVIHSHEIWTQPNNAAISVARELGIPYIISTHGMLEPWAWRYRAWKKRPAWWLWERRNLSSAAALRATAHQEVQALRALGLLNPIALIPNGVDLPPLDQTSRINGQKPAIHNALFISRIHPKKGLLNLVAAWSRLRPKGWRMIVCGPDECGHTEQVKQAAREAGLSDDFEIKPPVYGAEKEALYASAHLFVLPTFSENFGIAIAEALAARVPVITTKGAPWEELLKYKCGWWIDLGVEPLAAALHEAMSLSDQERHEMGERGRCLVEKNYSWPKIGKDILAVYEWILGRGARPACVIL